MAKNLAAGLADMEEREEALERTLMKPSDMPEGTKLKTIRIDDIEPNPKNDSFSQEDIDVLADSVRSRGLIEPLTVIFVPADQKYKLISGERRWRAISSLDNKTKAKLFPEGIPCNVIPTSTPEDVQEIMLYEANLQSRNYDQGEMVRATGCLIALLEKRKEAGELTNLKNYLAKKIDVSPRWAQSLINVEKRLIDGLKKLAGEGKISIERADKYSALPVEAQEEILRLITLGENPSDALMNELKEKARLADKERKTLSDEISRLKKEAASYEDAKKSLEKSLEKTQAELKELRKKGASTEEVEKEVASLEELRNTAAKTLKDKNKAIEKAEADIKKKTDMKLTKEDRARIDKADKKGKLLHSVSKEVEELNKIKGVLEEDDKRLIRNLIAQLKLISE